MYENLSSPNPIQPLSIGNVVTAGLRIYRSHFKSYFSISVLATLWGLLPLVTLLPLVLLFIYAGLTVPVLLLLIPVWLLLLLYGIAKYSINSALISRLAFGELVSQPENLQAARLLLHPKMWKLLISSILTFLIVFIIILSITTLFSTLVSILVGILIVVIGGSIQQNPAAMVFLGLAALGMVTVAVSIIIRLVLRFFILEVPLAIENNVGRLKTISRSWELTQGHVLRIFSIAIVAFLITLPIQIVAQLAANAIDPIVSRILPPNSTENIANIIVGIFGYIIGLTFNTLMLPFWQAIKAVIYYDLRTRREGLGLKLRDRNI